MIKVELTIDNDKTETALKALCKASSISIEQQVFVLCDLDEIIKGIAKDISNNKKLQSLVIIQQGEKVLKDILQILE